MYNGAESGFTPLDQPRRLLACVWNLWSSGQDSINHDAIIAGFQIGGAAGQQRQRLGAAMTATYILSDLFGGCESVAGQIAPKLISGHFPSSRWTAAGPVKIMDSLNNLSMAERV